MDLGNKIAFLRERKGLSQSQLADKLHISQGSLGMYETNKRKPNVEMLNTIADFFDVSVDYLLDRESKTVKTADIEDDSVIFTYEGRQIPKEDLEFMRRLMRGTRNDLK
ncbi:transcriptional regulator, XRE family [Ligilactobacillus salivarius cp400]|uniref:Transcriptional regulator, XRE family n=1 Tax=Ligilactobacillus salivarius cp400 TaxID=1273133 RepID=V6DK13_9LACO|nr:helix-turn-helix transcriptional regulator [Ligilactobacillus salivarius]RGM21389.1 XRE family transcriptional regulator [Ligilactobacillus salivarius]CDK35081.1 transcriptional regulator, XRE family [Ligilactobacillus salivarius cp400]